MNLPGVAVRPTRRRGLAATAIGLVAVAGLLLVAVLAFRPAPSAAPGVGASGTPGAGNVADVESPAASHVLDRASPVSTASPTQATALASPVDPGQVGFPTPDERSLLDRIPKEVRTSCRRALPRDGALGAISFICALPLTADADVVRWDAFDSPSQLDLAYSRITNTHDLGNGDCATDGSATMAITEYYDLRVACYQEAGKAYIAWTYGGVNARQPILGRAQRSGGDGAALFDWWKLVGPFLY